MKKLLLLIYCTIIFLSNSYSQADYEIEEMFLDADSWFFYEDYEEALPIFLRVLEADSLNYNVMYKIGFCYLHIIGQKDKSIPYLENAIKKTTFNYRDNLYTEKSAPVDALFYLGNAYLINNQIDQAIDAYTGFQNKIARTKKVADKDIYDLEYLNKQFDACKNAIQYKYSPIDFIAGNLGQTVNTRFNEFNAVISGDGNSLVFTASLQFYDAIFYSRKQDGKWSYPMNLMGQLGIDDKAATTGLSYDGTELYIYRDDDFDGNIYVSFLKDGIWSKAKRLNDNINTKYWESHASPSPDNKKLYFVSNREDDGYGDLDIYVANRLTDTTWAEPVNLGEKINTKWNENTPFITPDGKMLFFSSEGHSGMGGYDIFYSTFDNGQWSEPKNIGYPLNTTDEDIFFAPGKHSSFTYCSQFLKKGYGGQDIYEFYLSNLPEQNSLIIEGILTMDNEIDKNKNAFNINIINPGTKDTIAVLNPDQDNLNYEYQTPLGENHLVYESLLDEKTGMQYYISQSYDIKEKYLSQETEKKEEKEIKDTLPLLVPENYKYVTDTDKENVKIKLSLQKGGKLIVNTFYKDELINTEEFDITKEDFIYEYKPLVGESKIKFRLIDKNNNIKSEEVTVSYLPKDLIAELSVDDQIVTLSENGNKTVKIKLSVEKGSKLFVETFVDDQLVNSEEFKVRKESFVYEFEPKGDKSKINFKLVDKNNNVTNQEVVISHKVINKDFAVILNDFNKFDNKTFNKILNSKEVQSAASINELIHLIYSKASKAGLTEEQSQALIIALALNINTNTNEFLNRLTELAEGNLKQTLDSIKTKKLSFNSNSELVNYLQDQTSVGNYTYKDIVDLLEKYLEHSKLTTDEMLAILNTMLKIDINEVIKNMDSSAIDLVSIADFKNYLKNKNIYTEEELNYLYALIDGIIISRKASIEKENVIPNDQSLTSKENKNEEKNSWLILYVSLAGLILGVIIIYLNRRKNNINRK